MIIDNNDIKWFFTVEYTLYHVDMKLHINNKGNERNIIHDVEK